MPKRVEDVRLRIERLRLESPPLDLASRWVGSLSWSGVGGVDGSVEDGVIWKARCGTGRRSGRLLSLILCGKNITEEFEVGD